MAEVGEVLFRGLMSGQVNGVQVANGIFSLLPALPHETGGLPVPLPRILVTRVAAPVVQSPTTQPAVIPPSVVPAPAQPVAAQPVPAPSAPEPLRTGYSKIPQSVTSWRPIRQQMRGIM